MNADATQQQSIFSWIMLAVFGAVFYFMIFRPQQKKATEHKNLVNSLTIGDEVLTSAGMIGKITKLTEEYAAIEISEKVELKFRREAIINILPKGTLKTIA